MKTLNRDSKPEFTDEEKDLIEKLLDYPFLEKSFASAQAIDKSDTVKNFNSVIENLERVVRRGSQTDAEKAEKVAESCRITLRLLGEIDQMRTLMQKK